MSQWVLFFACALFVLVFVYPFYAAKKPGRNPAVMAAVKGLGTLVAAGLAWYGALRFPDAASWLIAAGITICAAADIVLMVHFLAGTALFLAGHLLYLRAFLRLAPVRPADLPVFALLCALALACFYPYLLEKRGGAVPYCIYGTALLMMLSAALSLPARIGIRGYTAAAGALLFAASDCLIARGAVKKPARRRTRAVMGLYYCAQLLLSLAALQPWR